MPSQHIHEQVDDKIGPGGLKDESTRGPPDQEGEKADTPRYVLDKDHDSQHILGVICSTFLPQHCLHHCPDQNLQPQMRSVLGHGITAKREAPYSQNKPH